MPEAKPPHLIWAVIYFGAFLFFGLSELLDPATQSVATAKPADISTTQGTVIGTDTDSRLVGTRRKRMRDECEVRVAYQVSGRPYMSETTLSTSSGREAEEQCAAFAYRDSIPIYYLRDDPSVARIDSTEFGSWSKLWGWIFCTLLGLAGLSGIVWSVVRSKPEDAYD